MAVLAGRLASDCEEAVGSETWNPTVGKEAGACKGSNDALEDVGDSDGTPEGDGEDEKLSLGTSEG